MTIVKRLEASVAVAIVVGLALVASTFLFGRSVVAVFRIRHGDKSIAVTGSVKRRIVSDHIVWTATIAGRGPDLAAAYRAMSSGVPKTISFLGEKGIDPKSTTVSAVRIREIHPKDKEGHPIEETISMYSVEQDIRVESNDVEKVAAVSRESTKLIEEGIQIQSEAPLYLYTKLGDLKIQLLAEASKDARIRADQIASNTGSRVTQLNSARMGVMQINAANESTTSGEGMNDTTSLEKDVLAIVSASFGIE